MSTTNTFLNYAVGIGTYAVIAAAIVGRNSGLAQQAINEIGINAGLRGIRFGTRRTAAQANLGSDVSAHAQNSNSNLDTVA